MTSVLISLPQRGAESRCCPGSSGSMDPAGRRRAAPAWPRARPVSTSSPSPRPFLYEPRHTASKASSLSRICPRHRTLCSSCLLVRVRMSVCASRAPPPAPPFACRSHLPPPHDCSPGAQIQLSGRSLEAIPTIDLFTRYPTWGPTTRLSSYSQFPFSFSLSSSDSAESSWCSRLATIETGDTTSNTIFYHFCCNGKVIYKLYT
jgi:hypothetical protein